MTKVEPDSSSAFELWVGALRFIFDLLLLAVVLTAIGFFIFTDGIQRSQPETQHRRWHRRADWRRRAN